MKAPLSTIHQFLKSKTPERWVSHAASQVELILIDHAHCEKKAASSALNLIYRYADKYDLLQKMSRLAREEMRHFEQVLKIIKDRKIDFINIAPSNYAANMHQHIASSEPQRLVDHLIVGAIIEARSCERFAALAPFLDDELEKFYSSLFASESRHFRDYLQLASQYADQDISDRVEFFTEIEAEYINTPDKVFRFHSGIPQPGL